LFLQVVDGQLTTCFMWRTKDDLVNMANGSLPLDFWRSDPTWKEGTPVFKTDVDFSRGPDLGGFKENWWHDSKNGGDVTKARPFRTAVEFAEKNPNSGSPYF
jgi:hypothetical protein